jgi:hypothetical protein
MTSELDVRPFGIRLNQNGIPLIVLPGLWKLHGESGKIWRSVVV